MGNHLTQEQKNLLGMDQEVIRALSTRLTNAKHRCSGGGTASHRLNYHQKGITVCDEWSGPDGRFNFLLWAKGWYHPGLELDRIDNSMGYSPENCRFTTVREGRRNRTNCRSFDEQEAIRLLRENGFSEVFISDHFPPKPTLDPHQDPPILHS